MASNRLLDNSHLDHSAMPRTRAEALALGVAFYFSGKPCRWKRHVGLRYASINSCVECQARAAKKWATKNPEEFRQRSRERYSLNKERVRAQARAIYHRDIETSRRKGLEKYYAHHEEYKRRHREAQERNKEKIKVRQSLSRQKNKERIAAYNKAYKDRNKALYASCARARYARQMNAMPPWVRREEIDAFYAEAQRLTKETGIKHQVDHIMPLQGRGVCGLHVPWNLQILKKRDNVRKSNYVAQELGCAFVLLGAAGMARISPSALSAMDTR